MTDAILIGGGPTGLLLANLLGARGLRVVLLEKQPQPYDLPRAVHFDGEIMRLFQSAGLAEDVMAQVRVNPGMHFKAPDGRILVDWSRDMAIGPMGWHESYRCHQPSLEAVLREGLRRYPHVTQIPGRAATGLRQSATHVTVETAQGPVCAPYVVACDGASSEVRHWLGIDMEDFGFEERWLVVDLRLIRDRPDLGDHSIQFCDPDAPATYVRGVGPRRRWEMRLAPHDPDTLATDQIWARLARWIGPRDATLERAAIYTFRARQARQWRVGRVFLAGDAAHQMPPFMGQGMCAGLRDAANLGWKLAATTNGASAALLDTYETERAPNARAFTQLSTDLGRLINRTMSGAAPEGAMRSIWPSLGPGLGPRDSVAGALVPQVARSDDTAPTGFYVLARGEVDIPLPVVTGAQEWLEARGVWGVIVRPDGYALASATTASELIAAAHTHADLFRQTPERAHTLAEITHTI